LAITIVEVQSGKPISGILLPILWVSRNLLEICHGEEMSSENSILRAERPLKWEVREGDV